MRTNALDQLFGCYFHQDWHHEYPDETAALNAVIKDVPRDILNRGILDIEIILNAKLGEHELGALLMDQIGCYFNPSYANLTYTKWLQRVRDFLKMRINV